MSDMAALPAHFVIRCGALLDATGAPPRDGAALVVRDGTFVAAPTPVPAHLPVLDLTDCFVMPGLVDAHAHLSTTALLLDSWPAEPGPRERVLSVQGNLTLAVKSGTTTMRVAGESDWLDLHTRGAIRSGVVHGPDLIVATRAVTAASCAAIDPVDDVVGMRQIVRENLGRGADFIKIHVTEGAEGGRDALLSAAAVRAAVEEAARAGTYVSAHGHGGPAISTAIESGVRSIEHGFELSDADFRAMADQGIWLVSTLAFDFHSSGLERVIDRLGPDYGHEDLLRSREAIGERMRAAITAGVPLAFGTNHLPGSMAEEIRAMVVFGMPLQWALEAATAGGAELLGRRDRIGTIEPGRGADLVAFRGNPFDDIDALDRVVVVIRAGVVVEGSAPLSSEGELK